MQIRVPASTTYLPVFHQDICLFNRQLLLIIKLKLLITWTQVIWSTNKYWYWKPLILHRNQKGFIHPVYKYLRGIFAYNSYKEVWRKPAMHKQFFFSKQTCLNICCITNKGKTAKNEWENDTLALFDLYTMYIKNLRQYFFCIYLLTCLNKDVSIVLKVINIWTR